MTADDRSFAPPHELVGPLGQVIDVGGGIVPPLTPAPVPGALATASPGVSTAAATSTAAAAAPGPFAGLAADDPSMLAAIARMANELFSQVPTSVVPAPLAPASALTASNLQAPMSPGLSPVLVAQSPAASPMPAASPTPAGISPVLVTSSPASLGPAPAFPASAPALASSPTAGAASTPMFAGSTPVPASVSPAAHPAQRPTAPTSFAHGEPWLPPHLQVPASAAPGATPTQVPATPGFASTQLPAAPGATPTQVPAAPGLASAQLPAGPAGFAPSWPFTIDSGLSGVTMSEVLRLPILGDAAADAAPYFVPVAGAVGLESDRGLDGGDVRAYEVRAEPAVVRDLGGAAFDPYALRRDFPILEERVHGGKRLIWLDNAATTQKPRAVIDRLSYFYEHENSNIHRAAHVMAARATDAYEAGRESARRFLNAGSAGEIIFVRGATEGINLIAQSWGRRNVEAGDEIVITHLEHHANIVPWQQLCQATGARLRVAPVDDRGDIILEAYERLLGPRTRLVAFPQVSNAIGTVTPAREMIEIAHRYGAVVALDGAQAVSHMRVDVQLLDCDFYVLSGHKVFAPTGIGVVYGKRALLEAMPPWQGGGNMIQDVTFERTTYQPPPGRFEAGTGSIADAVGLGAALDYVTRVGIDRIERYEHDLLAYADRRLATVPGLAMIGAPRDKAGVLSFVLDGHRTEDVGSALDKEGIAVRSGHHCAQPILRRLGVEASVRASLAFYNVCEDIDELVEALHRLAGRRL